MTKTVSAVLGGVALLALLWVLPVMAQHQASMSPADGYIPLAPDAEPGQIAFALRSGTRAWIDSNKPCAPNYDGPHGMWLAIAITNNAAETLTNTVATLSGFNSAYYALTADPVRYIGTLAPDATFHGFWFVDYTATCTSGRADTYTVTVSATNLNGNASYVGTLTSAAANSVGQSAIVTATRGSGIAVGQVYTQVVQYQFGNSNNATVLLQPTGDSGFVDSCFRLVGSEVIYSTVSGIATGNTNQLYFSGINLRNNDLVEVVYSWQALCRSESTSTPWTAVGPPTGKYSKDYGVYFSTFPTASISVSVTLSVTPTLLTQAGSVTYTVRLSNSFSDPVIVKGLRFALPTDVVYRGTASTSGIDNTNASLYPALNATGALIWEGAPLLSFRVPASGTVMTGMPSTLELIFTATAPAVNGLYTGVTSVTVGALDLGPLSTTFEVELPTAVELSSFIAAPQDNDILVTWETAMELDNVGFNLYRSTAAAGPYTLLNAALIPPQFPGQVMGGTYEWLDTNVMPDVTYYYRLEDIDVKGISTFHGPISTIVVTAPTAVGLQRVAACGALTPQTFGLTILLGLAVVHFQNLDFCMILHMLKMYGKKSTDHSQIGRQNMTKLETIEGIGGAYAEKLEQAGVASLEALLEQGKTPKGRANLAEKTGISGKLVLKWVNRADLFRVKGIGEEYADLLEVAGVDTVPELAQRNAENLYNKMTEVNKERKLARRLPSQAQVAEWIDQAKALPRVLTY